MKNHFDEIPNLTPTFNDFAECTDYYYNEYGKLEQSSMEIKRIKKMRKRIDKMFDLSLKSLDKQLNVQKDLDNQNLKEIKANIKITKKEFSKDYKQSLSDANKKQLINVPPKAEYSIDTVQATPKLANGVIEGQIELLDTNENQEEKNE